MFPFLMKGRNDSIAYYPVTIEVENLLDHLDPFLLAALVFTAAIVVVAGLVMGFLFLAGVR